MKDSTRYAGRLLMNPTVSVRRVFLSPTITALVVGASVVKTPASMLFDSPVRRLKRLVFPAAV